jgi:hypothetical protein
MTRKTPTTHKSHRLSPKSTSDPASLLARGYTARWVGASKSFVLQPLSKDEMDQDLRHMNAFWTACQRYQQHSYAAANRLNEKTPQTLAFPQQLPIRLDPDHDKRLQAARQRLVQAELLREALEQEYVAVRAHYVETCQEVQVATQHKQESTVWLQSVLATKAQQVAYLRARVQLTKDVAAALEYRAQLLEQHDEDTDTDTPMEEAATTTTATPTPIANDETEDPLLDAWTLFETAAQELAQKPSTKPSVMPWTARIVPSTPFDVPLLVSAASKVPEKSLAWACQGDDNPFCSGANPIPLVWMRHHLPNTLGELKRGVDDDEEDLPLENVKKEQLDTDNNDSAVLSDWLLEQSQDGREIRELRQEVARLLQDLETEGQRNATCLHETTHSRHLLDQWTSMISLVRQETEAVLYRHNVLLAEVAPAQWEEEPEEVTIPEGTLEQLPVSPPQEEEEEEELQEEEEQEQEELEVVPPPPQEEEEEEAQPPPPQEEETPVVPVPPLLPAQEDDGANDGDDEGDDEGGEQQDNWGPDNPKRSNEDIADSPTGSRKKRKVEE